VSHSKAHLDRRFLGARRFHPLRSTFSAFYKTTTIYKKGTRALIEVLFSFKRYATNDSKKSEPINVYPTLHFHCGVDYRGDGNPKHANCYLPGCH